MFNPQDAWSQWLKYRKKGGTLGWIAYYQQLQVGRTPPLPSRTYTWKPESAPAGEVPVGTTPTAPTTPTTPATPDENKKFYGYTAEEWGIGIPQFLWQQQQEQQRQTEAAIQFSTEQMKLQHDMAILSQVQASGMGQYGIEPVQNQADVRLAQSNQWNADRTRLLEGLPAGPEGDVARWYVQNTQSPYKMYGRVGGASANETGAQPLGPPAPEWLQEFAPGVIAGQPIGGYGYPGGRKSWETAPQGTGKMPFVPTPSGQQLTNMTPSQTRYLSGAMGYYGQRPWGDVLAEAELMQPQTPRGAGAKRWSPSRQV